MNPWDAIKPEQLTKPYVHPAERKPSAQELADMAEQVNSAHIVTDRDLGDETDVE